MNHPAVSSAPFHTVIHIGILAADILFVGELFKRSPKRFLLRNKGHSQNFDVNECHCPLTHKRPS